MKANELRIGNYIVDMHGQVVSVVRISEDGCVTKPVDSMLLHIEPVIQGGDAVYEILPIPLTEEWLVKFGFTKHRGGSLSIETGHCEILSTINNTWIRAHVSDDNEGAVSTRIKYVHQLQNLYFALTGEELEQA